jgi:hypothetical protein
MVDLKLWGSQTKCVILIISSAILVVLFWMFYCLSYDMHICCRP